MTLFYDTLQDLHVYVLDLNTRVVLDFQLMPLFIYYRQQLLINLSMIRVCYFSFFGVFVLLDMPKDLSMLSGYFVILLVGVFR